MSVILGLDEIGPTDGAKVGGKAVALAELRRSGQTVPRTLCVTSEAYDLFVDHAALRAVLSRELGRKSFAAMRWEELWDVSLRIRNRFLRAPIPQTLFDALATRLPEELGPGPFAVRSSAPGEDEPGASFAGLHDSFVGVDGLSEVGEAIRKVWASLWTDRALLYRRELGISIESSAMAVVIQELVVGSVSGVVFGRHPADPELVAVESVYGLNQGLVDGSVEPDRWSLERPTGRIVEHRSPEKRERLVYRAAGAVVESVPEELAATPPLDEEALADVFAAVRQVTSLFGAPQDMEWTFHDGDLVVLQSRPVTTAAGEGDQRAWYLSLTRSLESITKLRQRVENELLPAMEREADEVAAIDLQGLDAAALADEIERRRRLHDSWVETYTREFIPLAHGVRLFGQFYNETLKPEDPYAFMNLLVATPLLSVRRNRSLEALAARLRSDQVMREKVRAGEPGDAAFEQALTAFDREFGATAYGAERCFADRSRLVALLLAMSEAPPRSHSPGARVEELASSFLAEVDAERRDLANQLLELGRAAHRIRDDDNLYLSRLEALVLDAVAEGGRRLDQVGTRRKGAIDPERLAAALRHPNLMVEPRRETDAAIAEESSFRAVPRQLVGQPAGPGLGIGPARRVETTEDLFAFQQGEVLVCDAVDPNMTFVVPLASGVVERRGGMLIHGAIIAREYGLACVTGVPDAISLIATGDRLTVDGYLGIVTLSRD